MQDIGHAHLHLPRLKLAVLTIVLNLAILIALAFAPWSDWRTGLALLLLDNGILLTYALACRDELILRLIAFGLLVGLLELAADAWIVDSTKSLDYSLGGGPMIWRSPIWMPLAWEIVVIQFGYLGMLLADRFPRRGLLLTTVIGSLALLFYEEMAFHAQWWRYQNARMLPGTHIPLAIIIGEFFIIFAIAWLAPKIRRPSRLSPVVPALLTGVAIFLSYATAYRLILQVR